MLVKEEEFYNLTYEVRKNIIKMTANGGCFIGSALSVVDIIAYLYTSYLNISIKQLNDKTRDYFFLSKGHAVPALYSVFAEIGFLEKERLNNHLLNNDLIYWHPNTNIKGVEFVSGSLGHNIAVAAGVAINSKLEKINNKIFVLMGDGELNEGSVWEAINIASAKKLDNLFIIIDRNNIQANEYTEKLIPLEDLNNKFAAFNCNTIELNGHDYLSLKKGFESIAEGNGKPTVIIADTVRGKGIPSIENKIDKWFVNSTADEREQYLNELIKIN